MFVDLHAVLPNDPKVLVSFGLWDTALKFLSPGPRNDVTDHLVRGAAWYAQVKLSSLFLFYVHVVTYGLS